MKMNADEAVLIALGANAPFGHMAPRETLEAALGRFPSRGLALVKRSSWWNSAAWPDPSDPPFVNGVVWVETRLGARAVLAALQAIETAFGRVRAAANAPRTLDLDLIAHGRAVLDETDLTLPHPRAAERRFVMGPLAEIEPAWRWPGGEGTASELAKTATVGADAHAEIAPVLAATRSSRIAT